VFELAEALGIHLMPWQKYVLSEGLRVDKHGNFVRKTVTVLVARQQGKSALMRLRLLAGVILWDEVWVSMAQNLKQAENQWQEAISILQNSEKYASKIKKIYQANGRQQLEAVGGGKWIIVAANRDAARGYTANLWIDEIREITPEAFKASTPISRSYPNSQQWFTSNAGDAYSEVLNNLRAQALTAPDKRVGWFEWSADPDLPIQDKAGWYQANPALGWLTSEEDIAADLKQARPQDFITETLCRWVDNLELAWVMGSWELCQIDTLEMRADEPMWFAIDVTPDRRRADLVGGQIQPDGKIGIGLIQSWSADGAIDDLAIASDVAEWARSYWVQKIGYDKWTSASIAGRLANAGFVVEDVSGQQFARACDETLTAMNSQRLAHTGNQILTDHFMACVRKPASDGGWRVVRKGAGNISAACASIMVIHFASQPMPTAHFTY
jgi:phage terminase large subunit-like protein